MQIYSARREFYLLSKEHRYHFLIVTDINFGVCRVIFGMLIALPITILYYVLLGL